MSNAGACRRDRRGPPGNIVMTERNEYTLNTLRSCLDDLYAFWMSAFYVVYLRFNYKYAYMVTTVAVTVIWTISWFTARRSVDVIHSAIETSFIELYCRTNVRTVLLLLQQ